MANILITQLNNPAVLQQINQRLAVAVSMLLIVACAYVLVEITWMMLPHADDEMPVLKQNKVITKNSSSQSSFKNLTTVNIFGVSKTAVVQKQTKVPETRLNLTLKGLLAATPMTFASAIIAKGKNGKEEVYSIGDKMPGGILIKEIHTDHVLLDRNGNLEKLMLQKESGGVKLKSNRSNSRSGPAPGSPAAALKEIRSNILKNPTSFGDYALPMIVKENGKQIGYRLQPQKKGQLLAELGIQPSDVVTQINGVKLDKPQNGISALRKLSTAKNLNIVVKRNGVEVPLNISLQ